VQKLSRLMESLRNKIAAHSNSAVHSCESGMAGSESPAMPLHGTAAEYSLAKLAASLGGGGV
jgi:hypothetical protein